MRVLLATSSELPDLDADDRPLVAALAGRGIEARPAVWTDPDETWGDADLVVVRSTWDYSAGKRAEFTAWADQVGSRTRLRNPAEVLRWNSHKGYLMELEERGVPVVPTAFLGRGDRVSLRALAADRRWGEVVVKPAVSAGARDTFRVPAGQAEAAQERFAAMVAERDVLVQPFVPSITDTGEVAVLFVGGAYSHAVRKVPAAGEWRVQEAHGGRTEPWAPPREVRDLATWIIDATGHDYLYARVDLLADDAGTWQLTELEVTEPSLYLTVVEGAVERFADAIVAEVDPSGPRDRTRERNTT